MFKEKTTMAAYHVVLIDDEPIILQGLQILIDWEAHDLEIVGCASDGIQGLELIRELNPDIVISDIQMPNMNGVEMIKQIYRQHCCKFIVLSGYSDFSYAQQCISFGVQEYLLKPIVEEELIRALEKVKAQIHAEKASHAALDQLDDLSRQLRQLTLDDVLRDIINSYFETDDDFHHILSEYSLHLPEGTYYIAAAFQWDSAEDIPLLRKILTRKLDTWNLPCLLFYYGNNTFIGLFSLHDANLTSACAAEQDFHRKITQAGDLLRSPSGFHLCIGIGKADSCIRNLTLSCHQALHALSFKIIRGTDSVNPFDSSFKNAYYIRIIPETLQNAYAQSLFQPNPNAVAGAIRKIFQFMDVHSNMPLLGIQINTMNLIMTCIQYLSENQVFPASYEDMDYLKQIASLQSAEELEKYTENIVYHLISSHQGEELARPKNLISQIEEYISQNPLEDLSLIKVANEFYISPIYLSQTFKKQTGQLYLDYVTEAKIRTAKKMLLTTDLMVYEIAERLHYKDPKYFSKLFEKKTGKKPSEFRRNPR